MTTQLDRSAIYKGDIYHRRLRPKKHYLRYRMFYMLFDLDELDMLNARQRLFSYNRFNLFSFYECDHGGRNPASPDLKTYVSDALAKAGLNGIDGRIELLAMPRVLGYVFNPLSLYFCYDAKENLRAILYEVTSTFKKRRTYVLEVPHDRTKKRIQQACAKELYVSPFMAMEMDYRFDIAPPTKILSVGVNAVDKEGLMIATAFNGKRQPFTDATLLKLALAIPFQSMKVIAAIHWEALKLWLKGVRLTTRPAEPEHAISAPARQDRFSSKHPRL